MNLFVCVSCGREMLSDLFSHSCGGCGMGMVLAGEAPAAMNDPTDFDAGDEDFVEEMSDGDESMDGDFDSAMASAGFGMDEDYNHYDYGLADDDGRFDE